MLRCCELASLQLISNCQYTQLVTGYSGTYDALGAGSMYTIGLNMTNITARSTQISMSTVPSAGHHRARQTVRIGPASHRTEDFLNFRTMLLLNVYPKGYLKQGQTSCCKMLPTSCWNESLLR